MRLDLDRVPPRSDTEPRPHNVKLQLTLEEANWFTYARDSLGNAIYQLTGEEEELPPEEEFAYLCLRAGMTAMWGIMGGVPQEVLHVMMTRELVPVYDEETDGG